MRLKEVIARYDSFIFDFDGVIVDSLEIKAAAFATVFEDLGLQIMHKIKAHHLSHGGVSRYEKFAQYYREFRKREITALESSALDKQYSKLVVQQVIEAKPLAGVIEFLSLIKASHKFCCVVSATPQVEIRYIVQERGMNCFFKEVLGSPTSKKDNVKLILRMHNLSPKSTIYFGDAAADYEAAKYCGVDFIGVGDERNQELNGIDVVLIKDFLIYDAC